MKYFLSFIYNKKIYAEKFLTSNTNNEIEFMGKITVNNNYLKPLNVNIYENKRIFPTRVVSLVSSKFKHSNSLLFLAGVFLAGLLFGSFWVGVLIGSFWVPHDVLPVLQNLPETDVLQSLPENTSFGNLNSDEFIHLVCVIGVSLGVIITMGFVLYSQLNI